MDPERLRFSKTHEWVGVADGVATIGISQFAVEQLTDLVYLDIRKNPGDQVHAGQPFGEVESVKSVNDLYAPVDGEVLEVNGVVVDDVTQISQDPYGSGWLIKVRIGDESNLDYLLDYHQYQEQIAHEGH